jgi:hypothetical protein
VIVDDLETEARYLQSQIKLAIPAMREFAKKNPIHKYKGITQDPCGVHSWLARNDQDENPIL